MSTTLNPYSAPKALVADVSDATTTEAETIRRKHIGHEASIQSIGTLYFLSGFMTVLGVLVVQSPTDHTIDRAAIVGILALLAAAFCALGWGLRTLKPWARLPTTILSCIGLLAIPIGTLINGYILWLIHSAKGRIILSAEYRAIVEATPHVKYRTSIVVWTIVGLLLSALLAAILAPLFNR